MAVNMANIIGTGIDVIEVARIERALRIPSPASAFKIVSSLRARFPTASRAGADATRAMRRASRQGSCDESDGTGWNRNVGWSEIEVVRERGKAPTIALHGKSAAFAGRKNITHFHLSLTHTADQAIAHAIAEG